MEEEIRLETEEQEELEELTEETTEAQEDQDILYRTDTVKNPWFYDYAPALGVILAILAVCVLGTFMILDASVVTKLLGIVGTAAFLIYAGRFLYHFAKE